MPARTHHPVAPTIASSRYRQYRLGSALDRLGARGVAFALLMVFGLAGILVMLLAQLGPSEQALQLARVNPRQLLADSNEHFLPTPVTALAPAPDSEPDAGPPAASVQTPASTPADAAERVQVLNTGGLGALLRAEPPSGRVVASLRDGQVLEVLERHSVGDGEWLRVRTADGREGWVFGLLVAPAQ